MKIKKESTVVVPADSQLGIFFTKTIGPPVRMKVEVRTWVERMSPQSFGCLVELLDHHTDRRSPMLSGAGVLLKVTKYLFDHGSDAPVDKVARNRFSTAVVSLRKNEQLLKSGGVKCAFWKIVNRKING